MKIFWLNDALTVKAENAREREVLSNLLEILPSSFYESESPDKETGLLASEQSKSY
jgi:hypothetical protein